jgi:hypothetical protein
MLGKSRVVRHSVPISCAFRIKYDSDHGVQGKDEECIEERVIKAINAAIESTGFTLDGDVSFEIYDEPKELYEVEKEYEPC